MVVVVVVAVEWGMEIAVALRHPGRLAWVAVEAVGWWGSDLPSYPLGKPTSPMFPPFRNSPIPNYRPLERRDPSKTKRSGEKNKDLSKSVNVE